MRVVIGVTGGIAAYKAAELVRQLRERGLEVQVIMTRAACEFVAPLTFASLSGQKVMTGLFEATGTPDSAIEHIAVTERADVFLVAPATANAIAKLAHGIADDFLTTAALASKAPFIVAPAMNVNMWEHPATQANVSLLRSRGVTIVEPETGALACGMTGPGRLAAVEAIAQAVFSALGFRDDLREESILVTAGPTREPIDAVRHVSNRSSGKMGYALAEAACKRGARVALISGPTHLSPPEGVAHERIQTAAEMADETLKRLPETSVVLMAAAVADYATESVTPGKLKKSEREDLAIRLKRTRDILSEIRTRRHPGQIVVGFAAETDHLIENASEKLRAKGLDFIVANDVTCEGAGFEVDTNIVTILFPDGCRKTLEMASKFEIANCILDEIVGLRKSKSA